MNKILWTQNEDASQKDTFVIDGHKTSYSASVSEKEAFKILTEMQGARQSYKDILQLAFEKGRITSKFDIRKKENCGYLIISYFKETDVSHRHMPYMFFEKSLDLNKIFCDLKEYADLINRSIDDKDLVNVPQLIKDHDKKTEEKKRSILTLGGWSQKKKNKTILIIILLALFILLLL